MGSSSNYYFKGMGIVYENNIPLKIEGIDTINSALQNGKPIIVGVDYKIEI